MGGAPPERRVAFTVVLVVLALSVAVTSPSTSGSGGYLLAASLGLAALFRAVLPERYCLGCWSAPGGWTSSTAAVLAAAVAVVAGIVPV